MSQLRMVDADSQGTVDQEKIKLSKHLERIQSTPGTVLVSELVSKDGRFTILQGIAGIGKTTTVQYLVTEWANGKMYNIDTGPCFEFLFFLKCRNLNKYAKKSTSIEEILRRELNIQAKDLQHKVAGEKVLFLLDGLEELINVELIFLDNPGSDLHAILHDIIAKDSGIFPGHYTLVTTRPNILPSLENNEMLTGRQTMIEIIGFDAEAVESYVKNFAGEDSETAINILNIINASDSMQNLAHVPQLLQSVCSILSIDPTNSNMHTRTEIYAWVFVSFLKHHFPDFRKKPYQILKDKVVTKFLQIISKIAYDLLLKNDICFTEDEIGFETISDDPVRKLLESFLIKVETSFGDVYQFRHLTIHEFLAAVHCYVNGIDTYYLLRMRMEEVLVFIAGFCRAQECTEQKNIVKLFINCAKQLDPSTGDRQTIESQTVDSMGEFIFSRSRAQTTIQGLSLDIYFELVHPSDNAPSTINFQEETDFHFDQMSAITCVHFMHCMESIVKTQGPCSISGVNLVVKRSQFTGCSSAQLGELLRHFGTVSFESCSLKGDFVSSLSNALIANKNIRCLTSCKLDTCKLNGELWQLMSCVPFINCMDLSNVKIDDVTIPKLFTGAV